MGSRDGNRTHPGQLSGPSRRAGPPTPLQWTVLRRPAPSLASRAGVGENPARARERLPARPHPLVASRPPPILGEVICIPHGSSHRRDLPPSPTQFVGEGRGGGRPALAPVSATPGRHPVEVYTPSRAVCGRGWTSLSEAGGGPPPWPRRAPAGARSSRLHGARGACRIADNTSLSTIILTQSLPFPRRRAPARGQACWIFRIHDPASPSGAARSCRTG